MQVTCSRKELYEAVQTVGRAVASRSPLPILSHLLVAPQPDGTLRLTASDLEMWLECSLPAQFQATLEDTDDDGKAEGFTAPARVFTEVLAALPDADVVLNREDGSNKIDVHCARSNFSILGLPAEEFPAPPDVQPTAEFTISGMLLRDMIREVVFAVSTEESRPILTGVLVNFDAAKEQIKMVATDTHRLAVKNGKATGEGTAVAIIPARAMNEMLRLVTDDSRVHIALAPGQARVDIQRGGADEDENAAGRDESAKTASSGRAIRLVTRLIEGQFPNYERVIPASHDRRLTVTRAEFAASVRRAAIVARGNNQRVVLSTEGQSLILTAESGTVGTVREEVEMAREGDDITIAFNSKYLADVLGVIETEGVVLELTEPLRPGILRPVGDETDSYLCVLMPMQVL